MPYRRRIVVPGGFASRKGMLTSGRKMQTRALWRGDVMHQGVVQMTILWCAKHILYIFILDQMKYYSMDITYMRGGVVSLCLSLSLFLFIFLSIKSERERD